MPIQPNPAKQPSRPKPPLLSLWPISFLSFCAGPVRFSHTALAQCPSLSLGLASRSPARPARVRRPPSDTLGPLTVTLSLPVPRALIHDRPHLAASSSATPCTLHRDLAHLSAPSPSLTRTPAPAPCVADRHGPPVRPFIPAVTPARSRCSTSPAPLLRCPVDRSNLADPPASLHAPRPAF